MAREPSQRLRPLFLGWAVRFGALGVRVLGSRVYQGPDISGRGSSGSGQGMLESERLGSGLRERWKAEGRLWQLLM